MHADTTLAGLTDAERERIVSGIFALCAGEKTAPWLERRAVKRIAFRADLEKNIGQSERLGRVERSDEFRFLLGGGQSFFRRPIEIVHRGNPRTTELGLRGRSQRQREEENTKQ